MNPCNWERLQEIYHAAQSLPVTERGAFVTEVCAGDVKLLEQVNSLLNVEDDFLADPIFVCSSVADPLVGKTIDGRYVVQRELAGAGMGTVYVANDLQLRKLVVVKVLSKTALQDPDAVRRVQREIKALSVIEHPNVVTAFGAGEVAPGKSYIAMQYIDGVTLRSQISGKGMERERAASLLEQIGPALSHIHNKGVLHCDLKPENIMIQVLSDGTEVVKILDFGIAKLKNPVAATSAVNTVAIGTIDYMSPEQLREGENITAASDIYSLAVVACEMITGNLPVRPSSERRLSLVDLPPGLPQNVGRVLIKALSFEPTHRYQNAKQFVADLARALRESDHKNPIHRVQQRTVKKALAIFASLILALLSYGIYKYVNDRPIVPNKSFNYWVMVQKTHDGKDYEVPFKSNGKESFATGDKFQLNISTTESGYLYVFNEGPLEPETASFKMIYPRKEINNGSASVGANQTVQTDWITFRGPAGAENFWIVWSVSPVAELELAKNGASGNLRLGFVDNRLDSLKGFLKTLEEKVNSKVRRYEESQKAIVQGRTDILVAQPQFKHK